EPWGVVLRSVNITRVLLLLEAISRCTVRRTKSTGDFAACCAREAHGCIMAIDDIRVAAHALRNGFHFMPILLQLRRRFHSFLLYGHIPGHAKIRITSQGQPD